MSVTLGALGMVAAVVGTYFGVRAISKNHQAASICPNYNNCSSQDALTDNQDAKSAAQSADILLAGAAVAVVVGAVVYLTAPSSSPPPSTGALRRLRVVAMPSAGGGAVMLDGRW